MRISRLRICVLIALAVQACLGTEGICSTFYVAEGNPKASDSNAGTEEYPWKSIEKAMQAAFAGDIVYIKSGEYNVVGTGQRYLPALRPTNSGTVEAPITFCGYPNDVVNITLSSGSGPVIGSYGKNYIVFKNLIVTEGSQFLADCGVVSIWSSTGNIVDGLEIIGRDRNQLDNHNGIRLEAAQSTTIRNSRIHGFLNSTNIEAHNNSGITMYSAKDTIFEHNELFNCTCLIYDKCYGQSNIIRYNYLHNSPRGILVYGGCTNSPVNSNDEIYHNVLVDLSVAGVDLRTYIAGIHLYNNTFVRCNGSSDYGTFVSSTSSNTSGFRIWNNIFSNCINPYHLWQTEYSSIQLSDYNCFNVSFPFRIKWANVGNGTLAAWKISTGLDSNSTECNPAFIGTGTGPEAFKLSSGSPCSTSGQNGGAIGAYTSENETVGVVNQQLPVLAPPKALRAQ